MKHIRVLVTGAGSIVGQGIIKCLRHSKLSIHTIATDIAPLNAALFRADEGHIMPRVEAPGALEEIIQVVRKIQPDVLMIGSEFDLLFFSENKELIEAETGAQIIVSPPSVVRLAHDKFATVKFLEEHDLPHAPAIAGVDTETMCNWATHRGFPLILKPRQGTSARHVHIVKSVAEIRELISTVPHPMLQVLAGPPSSELNHEYTCSIFRCIDGTLRGPFICRRTLRGGSSWITEVVSNPTIDMLLRQIGEALPILGSLNVQLMLNSNTAIPFEFNARFSGTIPIRAYFGFNEPEMAIRNYFLKQDVPEPTIRSGVALRYVEEIFIDNLSAAEITEPLPKGTIMPWF
jgi:carbamoyl-phosphate synthase large subunit